MGGGVGVKAARNPPRRREKGEYTSQYSAVSGGKHPA